MPRFVLHVDLDQFIAAVEVLRRPELRGKPVVVGGAGDPTKRGVVSTASYEARRFGVDSGMPLRTAARKCPEAVFLPVDAPAYRAASERVMAALRRFPAVVEVAGWDEAFLQTESPDPEAMARDIQRMVLEETELSCSVGIGDNKLRAKLASGFAKPGGVFRLTKENWPEVMDRRTTDALWGIGRKRGLQLAEIGIHTVRELAEADDDALSEAFGPSTGPWLMALARGDDASPVVSERGPARSRGREETYQENLVDPERIRQEIRKLVGKVAADVADEHRPVLRVVVKVRFAPFFTETHSRTLSEPSSDGRELEAAAIDCLGRFELDRPVRLLGVRAELER